MTKARMTSAGREALDIIGNDPHALDHYSRQAYGMSARDAEHALNCLVAITRGEMPEGAAMKWAIEGAAKDYGWSRQETTARMRQCLDAGSPQGRVYSFLSAGKPEGAVTPEMLTNVLNLAEGAARVDLEQGLRQRLDEGRPESNLRANFDGMKASTNAARDADGRSDIRGMVAMQLGKADREMTFEEKRTAAEVARLQLANRIDAGIAMRSSTPDNPVSLRESLGDSFDLNAVRSASIDVGLGDFKADADSAYENDRHAFDPEFDITTTLNGEV